MKRYICIWFILCFMLPVFGKSETIRIATYNLMRFPFNNGTGRIASLRTVVQALNPDVLVVQELESEEGSVVFLDSVLNANQPLYASAPFVDGRDLDNLLYYKKDKLKLTQSSSIPTYLRNIGKYMLTHVEGSDTFQVYVVHLKAGSDAEDRERRQWDADLLRNKLNSLPSNSYFFVAGDFNVYNGTEPAFVSLTGSQDDNDGQCFDPVDHIGNWHNNVAFAQWHSQSTRTTEIDSGATGGLDDRFDFILCSQPFLMSGSLSVVKDSYTAFGNDGLHFNASIQSGGNRLVPDDVAEALYYASDHLPVYVDFTVEKKDTLSSVHSFGQLPNSFNLYQNFPNPFNNQTKIVFSLPKRESVRFTLYDVKGRIIRKRLLKELNAGSHFIVFNADKLSSGLYLYRMEIGEIALCKKMILMK